LGAGGGGEEGEETILGGVILGIYTLGSICGSVVEFDWRRESKKTCMGYSLRRDVRTVTATGDVLLTEARRYWIWI